MISLKDIAGICGVSESTVSKSLRDDPKIKAATRSRIQKIASQYNYQPSAIVRSLQTGHSMTIGVVNSSFDSFGGAIMDGLQEVLHSAEYEIIATSWDVILSKGVQTLSRFSSRRVEGLLVFPPPIADLHDCVKELGKFKIPIVVLDKTWSGNEFIHVGSDNRGGAIAATEHLIASGLRSLGCIQNLSISTGVERMDGFLKAMRQHGLPVLDSLCVDLSSSDDRYSLISKMLSQRRIEGLLCFNDYCAFQAMAVAHDLGIRVPEELSLVGFGDLFFSELLRPRLTTVAQYPKEIGRKAASLILEAMGKQMWEPMDVRIPVKLISKDSVQQKPKQETG